VTIIAASVLSLWNSVNTCMISFSLRALKILPLGGDGHSPISSVAHAVSGLISKQI
jgi:hypothetical protein